MLCCYSGSHEIRKPTLHSRQLNTTCSIVLHNDDITSDDVTGTVVEEPIGDKKSDTTHDDVMLNSKRKPL